ncbi:MAG: glutamine-hydrolyzing carbamoyl-phosphate synthase small subunit [Acidimicrobiia bacterium]
MSIREGALVLADGTTFEGEIIGADAPEGVASGEVVFNTVLSGYQEVITDPSYAGQIITFTYPHIGNYGTAAVDDEAPRPFCRGVIVRDLARRRSNWRSDNDLDGFLRRHGLSGIGGIDTRRLTRHLRDAGAMPGAFGTASETVLKQAALAEQGTTGVDLVSEVTCASPYRVGSGPFNVVAFDFGIKATMVRHLAEIASVEIVPASTSAADVIARRPDGIFFSNGPGDPEMVGGALESIRGILDSGIPVFGICLGHQLLSLALGGRTYKLPFGHHGGNHPVRNLATGQVEITSQNHNFCTDADSLAGIADITHLNLNDNTVEGMQFASGFSVQYHPEAGPGPHDARYLFAQFEALLEGRK